MSRGRFIGLGMMLLALLLAGGAAPQVKSLFRKLRRLALRYGGVIVFFDEADSLGRRGALAQGGPNFPGGGRTTPAAWQAGGCHGFSYLSDDVRWRLARRALSSAGDEPDTRRSKQILGHGRWWWRHGPGPANGSGPPGGS